jgi:AraC-like DNA-binding protein
MTLITLDFEAPPADLITYISGYYLFLSDEDRCEDIDRADIAQFRVVLSGTGRITSAHGSMGEHFPAALIGPSTVAAPFVIDGPAALFGVGFLPAGWVAFTGLAADKYTNSVAHAEIIFGNATQRIVSALQSATSIADMANVMNERWRAEIAKGVEVPHWFIRAVDEWIESHISPEIEALEATTGLSRRQIERMAREIYGSPPKLLARKYRALRTASAIAYGKGDWQDFIDDAYYDQSHCIREIKEFIGITPGAIRDNLSALTKLTLRPPQMMSRMPALSAMTPQ